MKHEILEIVGIFIIVVAACGVVAAASMVSTALAVLAAALFLALAGTIAVYVGMTLSAAEKKAATLRGERL